MIIMVLHNLITRYIYMALPSRQGVESMLAYRWSTVYDAGPTLTLWTQCPDISTEHTLGIFLWIYRYFCNVNIIYRSTDISL